MLVSKSQITFLTPSASIKVDSMMDLHSRQLPSVKKVVSETGDVQLEMSEPKSIKLLNSFAANVVFEIIQEIYGIFQFFSVVPYTARINDVLEQK